MNNIKESVKSIHQRKSMIQTTYDKVKAHGGEIKVEISEGVGTEFTIQLSIS